MADEPELPDIPQPTQARADQIKEQSAGLGPTAAPEVVDVPHVTGGGTVGQTLTCTMGNWTGEPTIYAYQWVSDGTEELALGESYLVEVRDAGHSIACVVTARNALGSTTAPPSNSISVPALDLEGR